MGFVSVAPAFQAESDLAGGRLSLNDWRRNNVSTMMQRLWQGINSAKSDVKFGISPFGIYRAGTTCWN